MSRQYSAFRAHLPESRLDWTVVKRPPSGMPVPLSFMLTRGAGYLPKPQATELVLERTD